MKIKLGSRAENYVAKEILLEEASPPSLYKSTIYIAISAIFIFIAWASQAQLDVISIGIGQATPINASHEVQNIDGGRIATIHVQEGEKVSKGQPLITLSDLEARTDLESLNSRYWASYTRAKALDAFLQRTRMNVSKVPTQYAELVAMQQLNLSQMIDQEAQLSDQISLLQEVKGIREELANQKLGTRIQAYESQFSLVQIKSELLRLRKTANQELHVLRNELNEMEQQLKKLDARLNRVEIKAPVDGLVQNLRFKNSGGVILPGTPLLNIVPIGSKMRAELHVSPSDIGFIKTGQSVKVKVTNYDFIRYGSIPGVVTMVAQTSMTDIRGNVYFNVYVDLNSMHMINHPDKVVMSGMTLQADILTDRQSVMRYMLRPIFVAIDQGMRER